MPTSAEILVTFPEFASVNPSVSPASIYLALADGRTAGRATWNDDEDLRNLAVALLAAHMLARLGLGSDASSSGGIQSERIGSAGVTYSNPVDSGTDDLVTTAYGRQLMELRKDFIFAPHTSYG